MKRLFLAAALLSTLHLVASAQGNADNIVSKLKKFSEQQVAEKVYLHFDKPYYAAGDTIYFKAYVTMGERHEPSKISGLLYADLINTRSKIDHTLKLQLINGVAWGDFPIADSLPGGNYRVRAYTNWMRNESEAAFFDQIIPIGSLKAGRVPESATKKSPSAKIDVQFFPEGGELVAGIRSKIAFKAIGADGFGTELKGVLLDNENNEAASFASVHLGMGSFEFTPQAGKSYSAKVTFNDGTQSNFALPAAVNKGITLSVNSDSVGRASVRIEANPAFYQENKDKEYTLLVWSGGKAITVPCKLDSTVIPLDIIKRRLHTGIATATLFSPGGEPFCERLFFIQNYDQLSLDISSDKTNYTKREKVSISLNVKDRAANPAAGNFSVSVIDESKVKVDEGVEHTILTSLLLTSDLKGNVEQPGYYFSNIADKTSADLDLVMLTHGYRRFEWKKLLSESYPAPAYQPENALEINGVAKGLLGKPLANGAVTLIPVTGGMQAQKTDDKGNFHFGNLLFTDTTRFVLQAVKANGKSTTQLVYKEKAEVPVTVKNLAAKSVEMGQSMAAYLENQNAQREDYEKYGDPNGKALKEVNIKGFKKDLDYPSSNLDGSGHADQVIHAADIELGGGPLSHRLIGKIRGIYWMPTRGGGFIPISRRNTADGRASTPMGIMIDGVTFTGTLDGINPQSVETIEIMDGAGASIRGEAFITGLIIITTKQGSSLTAKDIASIGVLPLRIAGFYKAREFYAPKYNALNINRNRPDLRTTIFWKPELVSDKDGNASFDYYNADGTGSYRVVVEGIDEKGNIGRKVYRYKVE